MKFYLVLVAAVVVSKQADAFSLTMQTFIPPPLKYNPSISSRVSIQLSTASATASNDKTVDTPQQTKTLGLLTFDLGKLYYFVHMMCTSSHILFLKFSYSLFAILKFLTQNLFGYLYPAQLYSCNIYSCNI